MFSALLALLGLAMCIILNRSVCAFPDLFSHFAVLHILVFPIWFVVCSLFLLCFPGGGVVFLVTFQVLCGLALFVLVLGGGWAVVFGVLVDRRYSLSVLSLFVLALSPVFCGVLCG